MATDAPQFPTATSGTREPDGRPTYIAPGERLSSITDRISALVLGRPTGLGWYASFACSTLLMLLFMGVIAYLIAVGVGI